MNTSELRDIASKEEHIVVMRHGRAQSLARIAMAADRLVDVCNIVLDRGYISSCIEEEKHDHQALVDAISDYQATRRNK